MKHIIIGDVHGCLDELLDLLDIVNPKAQDRVIFLGDLIHKGPKSAETVEFVMDILPKTTQVTSLLGNHEEKHIRWQIHQKMLKTGSLPSGYNPMQHTEGYQDIKLTEKQIRYLDNLPVFYRWQGFTAVHAGVLDSQNELFPKLKPWSDHSQIEKKPFAPLLRTRFQNPSGKMVKLKQEKPEDIYWAEAYDGRFGHIIFGHNVFLDSYLLAKPKRYPYATGIDLGCVHGGYLCAAVHEKDNKNLKFFSVKAKESYSPIL